jgi:polyferredoxin
MTSTLKLIFFLPFHAWVILAYIGNPNPRRPTSNFSLNLKGAAIFLTAFAFHLLAFSSSSFCFSFSVCVHVCMHACMYVCMHACMHLFTGHELT